MVGQEWLGSENSTERCLAAKAIKLSLSNLCLNRAVKFDAIEQVY